MPQSQALSSLERRALESLAPRASVGAKLLDAWSSSERESYYSVGDLVNLAGLGVTEEVAAADVVEQLTRLGIASQFEAGFQIRAQFRQSVQRLALGLHAISYYFEAVHKDETLASVVLTRPPQPSELERRLLSRGWRTADIETTRHAFMDIVASARKRVIIMTPFLDSRGGDWLCELFASTRPGVDTILILRTLESPERPDYPMGYSRICGYLQELGVRVFNYSIPRLGMGGRETFHAKVVLCDEDRAYVGSSNLTGASLEHSMELGIALFGRGATQVAVVMDAVLACATPWPYPHLSDAK